MSGFTNIIPAALSLAGSVTQAQSASSSAKARAQQVAVQNQMIESDRQAQATERRDLLARQQATQRAKMASWGVGGEGGSSDALLGGLSQRSDSDLAALNRSAALRTERNQISLLDDDGRSSASALNMAKSSYKVFSSFYD
ncbi:hypothetical protein [Magnetospirillum molischianum]|uniref:Uncharacterized protein n=1 Tax=Magnetospirillum molischianum DSM 120 TaxID=1150626 RepID=H8FUC0_MAGML|nr:hypothetical protein [Magnetospirillum molischianum]CCG41958.1 conserved exported hypothetical protein [Magnetospirillum molischianum DSM 120]